MAPKGLFHTASSVAITVTSGCSDRKDAGHLVSKTPSIILLAASFFSFPETRMMIFLAFRMEPIPMVREYLGTSSREAKNLLLASIVLSVSLVLWVTGTRNSSGSLKPI